MPLFKVTTYQPHRDRRSPPTRVAYMVEAANEHAARAILIEAHPWAAANALAVTPLLKKVAQLVD